MSGNRSSPWKWLALFFLSAWLLTILWSWRRLRGKRRIREPAATTPMDINAARKDVAKACEQHHAKACERALLHVTRLQWPEENVNNLAVFASRCHGQLAREIQSLDHCLYAKKADEKWQGDKLLQAFEQTDFSSAGSTVSQERQALPPLYPD